MNNIRQGNNVEPSIDHLNSLVQYNNEAPDGYVQITPYNAISDVTNSRKLDAINSAPRSYFGNITGKFNPKNYPVPQVITLKVGAQVMISKNIDREVINGTIGKINYLATLNSVETKGISEAKGIDFEEDRFSKITTLLKVGFAPTKKLSFDFFTNYDRIKNNYDGFYDNFTSADTPINVATSE